MFATAFAGMVSLQQSSGDSDLAIISRGMIGVGKVRAVRGETQVLNGDHGVRGKSNAGDDPIG